MWKVIFYVTGILIWFGTAEINLFVAALYFLKGQTLLSEVYILLVALNALVVVVCGLLAYISYLEYKRNP